MQCVCTALVYCALNVHFAYLQIWQGGMYACGQIFSSKTWIHKRHTTLMEKKMQTGKHSPTVCTICLDIFILFHIVTYYIKWVKTSWAHSIHISYMSQWTKRIKETATLKNNTNISIDIAINKVYSNVL